MSSCLCVWVCVCLLLCFILELNPAEGWFFQRVHLCILAIGGHELVTLSIRVHNSLTVHDNLWALKFDNFSEFQNVMSDTQRPPSASLWRYAYENRYATHLLETSSAILFKLFNNKFMKANNDKSHLLMSCKEPSRAIIEGSCIKHTRSEKAH